MVDGPRTRVNTHGTTCSPTNSLRGVHARASFLSKGQGLTMIWNPFAWKMHNITDEGEAGSRDVGGKNYATASGINAWAPEPGSPSIFDHFSVYLWFVSRVSQSVGAVHPVSGRETGKAALKWREQCPDRQLLGNRAEAERRCKWTWQCTEDGRHSARHVLQAPPSWQIGIITTFCIHRGHYELIDMSLQTIDGSERRSLLFGGVPEQPFCDAKCLF